MFPLRFVPFRWQPVYVMRLIGVQSRNGLTYTYEIDLPSLSRVSLKSLKSQQLCVWWPVLWGSNGIYKTFKKLFGYHPGY